MKPKPKYPAKRVMKFTPDKNNPDPKPTTMRDAKSATDVLPTKHGIYKPKPVAPAAKIPVTKPAPVKKKSKPNTFGNRKYKIQYSSPEEAKRQMVKGVKKRQKNKPMGNMFNR